MLPLIGKKIKEKDFNYYYLNNPDVEFLYTERTKLIIEYDLINKNNSIKDFFNVAMYLIKKFPNDKKTALNICNQLSFLNDKMNFDPYITLMNTFAKIDELYDKLSTNPELEKDELTQSACEILALNYLNNYENIYAAKEVYIHVAKEGVTNYSMQQNIDEILYDLNRKFYKKVRPGIIIYEDDFYEEAAYYATQYLHFIAKIYFPILILFILFLLIFEKILKLDLSIIFSFFDIICLISFIFIRKRI